MKESLFKTFKEKFLIPLTLSLIVVFSRVFLFKDFFHEFDPINFALAIRKFNVYADQPHPPGYPIYVLIGKIIFVFTKNELLSLQIESVVFTILSVLIFYLFLYRLTENKFYSFIGTVVYSFSGIFYFYGTVEDIYAAEAFVSILIGYLSYLSLKDDRYIYPLTISYGLIGGIRFNDLLFFFPLFLFVLIKIRPKVKKLISLLFILIIAISLWYIPTIYSGGGFKAYSFHSKAKFYFVVGTSILDNKPYWISKTFKNFFTFFKETFIIIISIIIFNLFKKDRLLIFYILWILPSFLFYFLIHTPKVGYYLTIIPSIYMIFFYEVFRLKFKLKKVISTILIIAITLNSAFIFKNLRERLNEEILLFKREIEYIKGHINKDSAIICKTDELPLYRHFIWYLPDIDFYFISSVSDYIVEWNIKKGYIHQKNREPIEVIDDDFIYLDKEINKILFITKRPDNFYGLMELKNAKINFKASLKASLTIIEYEIDKDFDSLFVEGFIIKRKR